MSTSCPITRADRRILQFYADGLAAKQIATRLRVPASAIHGATARMRRRTGTQTLGHLLATALRNGWVK